MSDHPADDTPLGEVRDWLRDRADDGERCPCCAQTVKVYRRALYAAVVKELILLYTAAGTGPAHWPTVHSTQRGTLRVGAQGTALPKAAYWHLVEAAQPVRRDDGGRAGWWRVTLLGVDFLEGGVQVPKYARVYAGRCLGLVGDLVSARDALGDGFNFDMLMALPGLEGVQG